MRGRRREVGSTLAADVYFGERVPYLENGMARGLLTQSSENSASTSPLPEREDPAPFRSIKPIWRNSPQFLQPSPPNPPSQVTTTNTAPALHRHRANEALEASAQSKSPASDRSTSGPPERGAKAQHPRREGACGRVDEFALHHQLANQKPQVHADFEGLVCTRPGVRAGGWGV